MKKKQENNIPEIPPIPEPILQAAERGKLVVFIGAGVSRIIGCPSWKEFALLVLKDLYVKKKVINFHEYERLKLLDPRKLLSICEKLYKENNLSFTDIKSYFKGNEELIEKYKIYDYLYSFNAIYVTTNYDIHLDEAVKNYFNFKEPFSLHENSSSADAIRESDFKSKIIVDGKQALITDLDNGKVIHIHGSVIDENSLIISIVDYLKHYQPESRPAIFLDKMFKEHTVLFLGYGLEEYEILEFIVSKAKGAKKEKKHFMLYPTFKQEINILNLLQKYYEDLGITLIPYSIDKNGYESLANVIRKWAEKIGTIAKPKSFYDNIKIIDEVVK